MITQINIKNFKSIVELELPLGRFNVFIGANGCGKTNILEGISFGAAALVNRFDNENFGLRGIRVTEPQFMYSGFETEIKPISIKIETKGEFVVSLDAMIVYDTKKRWLVQNREATYSKDGITCTKIRLPPNAFLSGDIQHVELGKISFFSNPKLINFLSYCPEESALRTFREEIQTLPVGRKGEGLFRYLKELGQTENGLKILQEIKENLSLLDWYDDLKIPENSFSNDSTVLIRDRYLNETLQYFDQRSTNEGFLYLLFYLTLFISDETPEFFAIDNIESSFNPKMCTEVIRTLTNLARTHGKQVIVTTHNPAVLDGLNLANDDERLLVVRRNIDGHTKINRVEHKAERSMKLSEIWMNGFIGGLPDNF